MAILLKKNNVNVEAKADANGFLLVTEGYARRGENIQYRILTNSSPDSERKIEQKIRLWGIHVNEVGAGSPSIDIRSLSSGGPGLTALKTGVIAGNTYPFIPGLIFTAGIEVVLNNVNNVLVAYEPLG